MNPTTQYPRELTEAEWTAKVIEIAQWNGWKVHHARPARTTVGWRTAIQGHVGAPDLLLARDGDVICAELKRDSGRLRPEQREWLAALGSHGCVWRPADSDTIRARLARRQP